MRLLCMPTGLSDSETNIRTSARFYSLLAIATDVAVADPGIGGGDDLCSPLSLPCPPFSVLPCRKAAPLNPATWSGGRSKLPLRTLVEPSFQTLLCILSKTSLISWQYFSRAKKFLYAGVGFVPPIPRGSDTEMLSGLCLSTAVRQSTNVPFSDLAAKCW